MNRTEPKIQLDHLQRQAYIYVRQFSPHQVQHNLESQRRQYALRERAIALGWPASAVVVIDEDQGTSSLKPVRPGFEQLLEATSRGEVGAIFNIEVSRLARESGAWGGLMRVCAWENVLLIDETAVYDPNLPDDRMLLGLRGLFSEAELDQMHRRLTENREAKARRGELRFHPPAGVSHDPQGRLRRDPDAEVQGAVQLLFDQFRRLGRATAVVRYFREQGVLFPTRVFGGVNDGALVWKPLTYQRTLQVLHNPLYAGAYAYGRRAWSRQRPLQDKTRRGGRPLPMEDWIVCQWEAFPGYISRTEYEAYQRQLAANRPGGPGRGVARVGEALLAGLLLCGHCGQPMQVTYRGTNGQYVTYVCRPWRQAGHAQECQRVPGAEVDRSVAQAVLAALRPAEIDLSLQVLDEMTRQADEVRKQWERRVERACYEADLARRRYQQVEPEHRLVARTLEREWEDHLAAVAQVEQAYAAAQREQPLALSEAEREQLRALARDLPALWTADTTTPAERKEVLRLLVAGVTLTRRTTDILVQVRWITNVVDEWTVPLPQRGARTPATIVDQIRALASTATDVQIAAHLNDAGHRTAHGKPFTAELVKSLRRTHQIDKVQRGP